MNSVTMKIAKLGLMAGLISMAGIANVAHAMSAEGFYVGVGALSSESEAGYVADSRNRSLGGNTTGPLVTAGYQYRYGDFFVAGELRWTDKYGEQLKADGVELSLNPGWQINEKVSVFARFGTTRVKTDAPGVGSAAGRATVQGLGVDYNLRKNWSVRAEYQEVKGSKTSVSGTDLNAPEIKSVAVSVLYRF